MANEFSAQWLKTFFELLETRLPAAERQRLMEDCGRVCAQRGATGAALACQGNLTQWLETLRSWVGADNVQLDGNVVRLTYPRCLCELVAQGPAQLPATFCYCSGGWLKEVFEAVTARPVEVTIVDAIRRGGPTCRFEVRL